MNTSLTDVPSSPAPCFFARLMREAGRSFDVDCECGHASSNCTMDKNGNCS
jgi:hypothetical protein